MSGHRSLLPPGWPRPRGYSNGIEAAPGRTIFTGGVVGWDAQERFVTGGLAGQFRRILFNTLAILREAGAGPEHVVRMTWYIISREEYLTALPDLGAAWREHMGNIYPAMAVLIVGGLVETEAL
ncbi:MAG: endoribonuclease, partial [Alphaproteobacteria bacterium]|nr:endoribonuclease [Alphaproteobacteria bacterium]